VTPCVRPTAGLSNSSFVRLETTRSLFWRAGRRLGVGRGSEPGPRGRRRCGRVHAGTFAPAPIIHSAWWPPLLSAGKQCSAWEIRRLFCR